jgi:hypothetical protein
MSSYTTNVKGTERTFNLLTERTYVKKHGDESVGMTISNEHVVDIRAGELSFEVVCHELCHIYHFSSLVNSSDLTSEQTVELMCEIMSTHYFEIGRIANEVILKLNIKKKEKTKEE